MTLNFEKKESPNGKEYNDGYAAYLNLKKEKKTIEEIEAPFSDPESPEAEAWFRGLNDAKKEKKGR